MKNVDTVSLLLTPERVEYPEGSLPDFREALKNVTPEPVKLVSYMLRYRLMMALTATHEDGVEYGLYPFQTAKWEPFKPEHLVTLAPGQTLVETLKLSSGLGWGFVKTGSQPPLITSKFVLKGFPAGTVSFSTCVFENVSIYTGGDGVYDDTLQTRRLSELLPDATNDVQVFRGNARGRATVKFTQRA